MKLASLFALCRQATVAWIDDYAPSMGAALAYYTLFSVAPLLLIVISIAGLVFGPDAARGHIFAELRDLIASHRRERIALVSRGRVAAGQFTPAGAATGTRVADRGLAAFPGDGVEPEQLLIANRIRTDEYGGRDPIAPQNWTRQLEHASIAIVEGEEDRGRDLAPGGDRLERVEAAGGEDATFECYLHERRRRSKWRSKLGHSAPD